MTRSILDRAAFQYLYTKKKKRKKKQNGEREKSEYFPAMISREEENPAERNRPTETFLLQFGSPDGEDGYHQDTAE